MFSKLVDIKGKKLFSIDLELLKILLKDNSSNKNIIWATDNYAKKGPGFDFLSEITEDNIIGKYKNIVKPRAKKNNIIKAKRVRENAEVFTPSWLCNEQNNLVDEAWFKRKDVFNISEQKKWITNYNKIEFGDLNWKDYVRSKRLEISCGEAPYLVSRYDTVTGKSIKIKDRIGFLDRKLRIVSENNNIEEEWIEWAVWAMKSVYGFDWQGDNVLLARENLLYTFIDYYRDKFNKKPQIKLVKEIATIISWNIWQMDGIRYVIPNSCNNQLNTKDGLNKEKTNECLCEGCRTGNNKKHNGIYCKIKNWDTNRKAKFINLFKK